MKDKFKIYETAGVHNVHGLPGILGGLISAIAIVAYTSDPLIDPLQQKLLNFYSRTYNGRSFYAQGAIQVAGTFVCFGMAIVFGAIAGFIMRKSYHRYRSE